MHIMPQLEHTRKSCFKPSSIVQTKATKRCIMGRWMKPEVYPLLVPMTFVVGLCAFQLTRNLLMNPDVRLNKAHRVTAVLENQEEGEKYAQHGFRQFLRTRPPEVMPAINRFFSDRN